jgi:hypothetical protein
MYLFIEYVYYYFFIGLAPYAGCAAPLGLGFVLRVL